MFVTAIDKLVLHVISFDKKCYVIPHVFGLLLEAFDSEWLSRNI